MQLKSDVLGPRPEYELFEVSLSPEEYHTLSERPKFIAFAGVEHNEDGFVLRLTCLNSDGVQRAETWHDLTRAHSKPLVYIETRDSMLNALKATMSKIWASHGWPEPFTEDE